ncbi:MAG: M48 family metalloprotease [bacterium]
MATTYTYIAVNKRRSTFLVVGFIVFVLLLGWVLSHLADSGLVFLVVAALIATCMTLVGYYRGDRIALWTSGAEPMAKEQSPYVYRLVENLCITAGLPMPAIYLIPDDAPNAFATGRDPAHASLALTTGIVRMLENEELEGVIAHELSHIGNYDIRYMTLVSVLVGIVAIVSHIFLRSMWFGGGRRQSNDSGGNIFVIVGLVLLILSPLIAQLIRFAVSRKREFLADASGALLTRYPQGLASALEKIGTYGKPLAHVSNATAPLFIANPLGSRGLSGLFSTHPPIADRVRALKEMAAER